MAWEAWEALAVAESLLVCIEDIEVLDWEVVLVTRFVQDLG